MLGVARRLAVEAARVIEAITTFGSLGKRPLPLLLPLSLTLTGLVSLTQNLYSWAAALVFSLVMLPYARPRLRELAYLTLYLAVFAAVIELPVLITGQSRVAGLSQLYRPAPPSSWNIDGFLFFVARITLAPLPIVTLVYATGWPRVASTLYRIKHLRRVAGMLTLSLLLIPRSLRNLFSIVAAREARTFEEGYMREWKLLATAVGDFIADSTGYSKRLEMAIKARTFTEYPFEVRE
ncbi:MAG: hypothetical protein F7C35_03315 [Desulfurococcales archaeon]|nr:hypothetical protein [Desulfurococcales archaeon]